MDRHFEDLNGFLVGLFNDILKIEENTLRAGEYREISVRDMHILETICAAQGENSRRTTAIARELGVTTGTLTVAVNTLVKKGYLERQADPKDRRVVLLHPTEKALRANQAHRAFHRDMVAAVMQALTEQQTEVLVQALNAVRDYFESRK